MVLFGTRASYTAMSRDIPKILTDDEAEALLDALNCRYDSGLKNTCMFRLMLEVGLRVSELSELRRRDVDMTACRVTIRDGKGGKDRQVWMSEDLRNRIGEWLERRPDTSEGWMFPTRTGQRTSPRSVRRSVKTYAERAELDDWEAVSPHTLRHTFATNLLRKTGNIRLVQKALGHARLSTTMIYTHIVDDELEEAMKKTTYSGSK
jgi:site-specific recombinase XerD